MGGFEEWWGFFEGNFFLEKMDHDCVNQTKHNFWVKGSIRSCGFLRVFKYTDDECPAGLEPPSGTRS